MLTSPRLQLPVQEAKEKNVAAKSMTLLKRYLNYRLIIPLKNHKVYISLMVFVRVANEKISADDRKDETEKESLQNFHRETRKN